MSVKNFSVNIIIKDLTRGNVEVIHDYFKYNDVLQMQILWQRLNGYLNDNQNFSVEYMREEL